MCVSVLMDFTLLLLIPSNVQSVPKIVRLVKDRILLIVWYVMIRMLRLILQLVSVNAISAFTSQKTHLKYVPTVTMNVVVAQEGLNSIVLSVQIQMQL